MLASVYTVTLNHILKNMCIITAIISVYTVTLLYHKLAHVRVLVKKVAVYIQWYQQYVFVCTLYTLNLFSNIL